MVYSRWLGLSSLGVRPTALGIVSCSLSSSTRRFDAGLRIINIQSPGKTTGVVELGKVDIVQGCRMPDKPGAIMLTPSAMII